MKHKQTSARIQNRNMCIQVRYVFKPSPVEIYHLKPLCFDSWRNASGSEYSRKMYENPRFTTFSHLPVAKLRWQAEIFLAIRQVNVTLERLEIIGTTIAIYRGLTSSFVRLAIARFRLREDSLPASFERLREFQFARAHSIGDPDDRVRARRSFQNQERPRRSTRGSRNDGQRRLETPVYTLSTTAL